MKDDKVGHRGQGGNNDLLSNSSAMMETAINKVILVTKEAFIPNDKFFGDWC